MSVTQFGFPRLIGHAIIPGGAAGTFDVQGDIKAGDTLLAVAQITTANPPVPTDILADASIPAGTSGRVEVGDVDTTGSFILISWAKAQ